MEFLTALLTGLALLTGIGIGNSAPQEEIAALRAEVAQMKQEKAELLVMLDSVKADKKDLEKMLGEIESQHIALVGRIRALEAENQYLRDSLSALGVEHGALRGEVGNLAQWQKEAEASFAAMRLEREKRDALVKLGMQTAHKLLAAQATIRSLKTELQKSIVVEKELRQTVSRLLNYGAQLTEQVARYEAQLAEKNAELVRAKIRERMLFLLLGAATLVIAIFLILIVRALLRKPNGAPLPSGTNP